MFLMCSVRGIFTFREYALVFALSVEAAWD